MKMIIYSALLIVNIIVLSACTTNNLSEKLEYHKNSKIKNKYFVDPAGLIQGKYVSYYESGNVLSIFNYKDSLLDGNMLVFYDSPNFKIKSKGQLKEGRFINKFINYNENGRIVRITVFDEIGREIEIQKFHDNGMLKEKYYQLNGDGEIHAKCCYTIKGELEFGFMKTKFLKIKEISKDTLEFRIIGTPPFDRVDSVVVGIVKDFEFEREYNIKMKKIREIKMKATEIVKVPIVESDYYDNYLNIYIEQIKILNKKQSEGYSYYFQHKKGDKIPTNNLKPIYYIPREEDLRAF